MIYILLPQPPKCRHDEFWPSEIIHYSISMHLASSSVCPDTSVLRNALFSKCVSFLLCTPALPVMYPSSSCFFPSQMAQRLLLRRFLTSIIPRTPPQGGWAPLTSRTQQTPQHSHGGLPGTASPARTLHTTRVCSTTFNVQDGPDFQDRVVNSETPVVVDFHAQ